LNTWQGKRVYVMGLGRFGGGVGVTRYLASQGAEVRVGDSGTESALQDSIESIQGLINDQTVELIFGPHEIDDLDGVDVLVVNPAVPRPWENPFVCEAEKRGIEVNTEIEILYQQLDSDHVIAITGSAGKSTTSAMIYHALLRLGHRAVLGGNIGGSLLGQLEEIDADTWIVLELSSAMLYWLSRSGAFKEYPPKLGCITNCVPNHLDWHGDAEHYERSKRVLAGAAQRLVLGEQVRNWGGDDAIVVDQSNGVDRCAVPGTHNAQNAAIAANAVCCVTGAEYETVCDSVRCFAGLPHRLQLVGEASGVKFYNDSKCTVPDAALLAVDAMEELVDRSRVHLIAGGYDKGSDLSPISERSDGLAGLYCIGATGSGLAKMGGSNATDCGDLQTAMSSIKDRMREGDVVLLSPGCASWDQFENYEARGELFAELVRSMSEIGV
jgi:UDP-N-acetylmuramoylalanine--D-glutamate ligase